MTKKIETRFHHHEHQTQVEVLRGRRALGVLFVNHLADGRFALHVRIGKQRGTSSAGIYQEKSDAVLAGIERVEDQITNGKAAR
jgi:hypothetical protein